MNLPNKITLARIFMIPLFAVAFYLTVVPYNFVISAVIFAIASFTDFLDGYIARKYHLVTDMGKFLDPIADKVLVSTALILCLVLPSGQVFFPEYAFIAPVCVALIMARELIVSGFRLVASGKNMVIAADWSGKIKTFFTDVTIIVMLISLQFNIDWVTLTAVVMLILSTLLTVYSGAECIIKNRAVLKDKGE